jgi:cyclopropane fatty-acyl-phospholipid synthase-like methyltransferase
MAASFDNTLTAPAVARNRAPILDVLRNVLPATGTVLEIASGSGEHAVHFAAALPHLVWQPTDPDAQALRSIAAHAAAAGLANLRPPLELDACTPAWPVVHADAVVSINMIHIAPWRAAQGLIEGAERLLPPGAPLYLYGPFRERGRHTAPSNATFDASLQARDPEWGVRDLDEVAALAARHGLTLTDRIAMPANNLSVVFRRSR